MRLTVMCLECKSPLNARYDQFNPGHIFAEACQKCQTTKVDHAIDNLFDGQTIREEVCKYAASMEKILRENDHKRHWSTCDNSTLMKLLQIEVGELVEALMLLDYGDPHPAFRIDRLERVLGESTDVGNLAMMVFDNYARLLKEVRSEHNDPKTTVS